jgi:hypothetical protein
MRYRMCSNRQIAQVHEAPARLRRSHDVRPLRLRDDERRKQRYVYYHCTGFKGSCGNTYIREEELSQRFEEVVRRIQIPSEVADAIAETLRTSQAEKERFHRTAVMQLQRRYLAVQNRLDRAYDDRLAGNITDEMWSRKSQEWQGELEEIRRETSRHERASADYSVTGSKILALAKNAHNLFIRQNSDEQARLLKSYFRTARSIAEVFLLHTISRSTCSPKATKLGIGGESGIRSLGTSLESVTYRF